MHHKGDPFLALDQQEAGLYSSGKERLIIRTGRNTVTSRGN